MNITFDAAIRPDEQDYVKMVQEVTELLNTRFDFKITDLRFARKPKAFGSEGTANFHRYTYHSRPEVVEIWVNLAHGMLSSEELAVNIARNCLWSTMVYNHKECTAEMLATAYPKAPVGYKFSKAHKMSALHNEYMRSTEVLSKLHGPISTGRLLDMSEEEELEL